MHQSPPAHPAVMGYLVHLTIKWHQYNALCSGIIMSQDCWLFFHSATFDVQNVTATSTGSKIFINGTFATNSTAKGLFVVLQCDDGSPDEFRALLSEGNREHDVTVPSSTYTILVYDLEHTALPSERVAFMPAGKLTVENGNITV